MKNYKSVMELCTVSMIIAMTLIAIPGIAEVIHALEDKSITTIIYTLKVLFIMSIILAISFAIAIKIIKLEVFLSLVFGTSLYFLPLIVINLYTATTAFWITYISYIACIYSLRILNRRSQKRSQESTARKEKKLRMMKESF